VVWALLCGACIGLMHATKETCVIAYAALAVALLVARLTGAGREDRLSGQVIARASRVLFLLHVLCGLGAAVVVSVVLFSSFFANPTGPLDSLRFIATYLGRAGGQGSSGLHEHPWYFYLRILTFYRDAPGPWWSEGLILLLAACGIVAAITREGLGDASARFSRFLAVYTVLMVVIYSAIPYKTPWCLLGFLHGLILLAGVGAVAIVRSLKVLAAALLLVGVGMWIIARSVPQLAAGDLATVLLLAGVGTAAIARWVPKVPVKILAAALMLAAGLQLAWQAHRTNHRFCADMRNPYVYAHTSRDLLRLPKRAHQIAAIHPAGYEMRINVIAAEDDYWPLPWYLRQFNQSRIGYWSKPPENVDAPMVIAGTSQGVADGVEARLRDKYQAEYIGLRPNVLLRVYIRRDLWQKFLDNLPRTEPK
jgi:predicted membrane-bound mannosyltransferase